MAETFYIADLHFGHKKMTKREDDCAKPLRPWSTPEEMDEELVRRWNSVVSVRDKVYLLGDVVINRRCLPTISRLQGGITLVMGNHETMRASEYMQYVAELRGAVSLTKKPDVNWILTHVPVHPREIGRWTHNIHGHLHAERVTRRTWYGRTVPDARYLCVSAEQVNYTPIHHEEVRQRLGL